MHGTCRVLWAMSVSRMYQSFTSTWLLEVVARLVRRLTVDHWVLSGENSSPLVDCTRIHQKSVSTI